MIRKTFFGVVYVSAWVMLWGTIGSLIDWPFLNAEIYYPESAGQITTFTVTAVVSLVVGIWLYPKVLHLSIVANFLALDTDKTS
ncbi:hypothetical protein [Prochlorococcus sp. MIT 1307]|uniref:hypothetical protein n=1 Tax=Prochlorococcus sp. MIT 1307 TaxID=3096219 RepID=UPI002A7647E4|nr:hypothetical protein [Prochlorococcus sp. MIT 1307]